MEITLDCKPLSVNKAWKGRRFKTDAYKNYEYLTLYRLPKTKLPEPPFSIRFEIGFSNVSSDLDNPVKLLLDILQKKYGFNDSKVFEINMVKRVVEKGKEFVNISIDQYEPDGELVECSNCGERVEMIVLETMCPECKC